MKSHISHFTPLCLSPNLYNHTLTFIRDQLVKMANLDLVDPQDQEVTMEKMETKVRLDPRALLANKEREEALDPRETRDSKVFPDLPVTLVKLVDLVSLV